MISIKGKNSLITGSSRGIGQQIAIGLAKLGSNIIVHGRKEENCIETIDLLKEFPVKVYSVFGELSSENTVDTLISKIRKLDLDIDLLYNNAAIMTDYHHNYWEHSYEEWLESYKVNVIAPYKLCQAFMPDMIRRGFGRIVNLTSRIKNQPELAPYGASKWAVDKITDDLASKLNGTGVRINTLDPGWLRTDMGGENAEHPLTAVLPGALAPALIDNDGANGQFFSAIDHELDTGKFN